MPCAASARASRINAAWRLPASCRTCRRSSPSARATRGRWRSPRRPCSRSAPSSRCSAASAGGWRSAGAFPSVPLMSSFVKATQAYQQGQRTLPGRYYTSPEIYAEEQERIFTARWICVGRAAEIPAAGDYVLRTIAGESVIVVRGRDGALRAFYNVCRHRGTRLCEEPRGRFSETIQCPYHAWTYTIDGQLIGAPHMSEVQGFDKHAYPLHAVSLDTWDGFVFVNLAGEAEPLASAFAAVGGRFGRFNLTALTAARRVDYEVAANWKLILQNYSECLHCPVIHPGLAKLTPRSEEHTSELQSPCNLVCRL